MHYINTKHTQIETFFFCKEHRLNVKGLYLLVVCGLVTLETFNKQTDGKRGRQMTQEPLRTVGAITMGWGLKRWRWVAISVFSACRFWILRLLLDWEDAVIMFCLVALPRPHQGWVTN